MQQHAQMPRFDVQPAAYLAPVGIFEEHHAQYFPVFGGQFVKDFCNHPLSLRCDERALQVDGATRLRAIPHLLAMARRRLVTAVLAGFGRTISEVGAILIVGGNIAGYTRTMTTTIVLETSKGNLSMALGLGFVLIGISVAVSATIFALGAGEER